MSWRIVVISSNSKLDCKMNYLVIRKNSITIQELCKLFDLKIEVESETFLEKIIDYISTCSEYQNIKVFVFVNLKTFLSPEDLKLFYKYVFNNKIQVLLLENSEHYILNEEIITIIDNDLCEINYNKND